MELPRGIAVEAVVTVDRTCEMSCEIMSSEIDFTFGPKDTGLHLYFDWPGLFKFAQLAATTLERVLDIPDGEPIRFVINADGDGNGDADG